MKYAKLPRLLLLFIIMVIFSYTVTSLILAQEQKTVKITLGDNGFSPKQITIKQGTIVSWEVEGKNLHWPASDFHPSHGEYPEGGGCIGSILDACRAMKRDEHYSFIFEKAGTWQLHDHLNPGLTMTVEVFSTNSSAKDNPSKSKKGYMPKEQYIADMAKKDPEKAWKLLKKTFIINGQVTGNAHGVAHIIGNEAYNKFGLDGIKICDDAFSFGCYHGVSEKMLLVLGKDSIKKIESECARNWPPDNSPNFTGCIHGTGHGLVAWLGLDLEQALIECNVLEDRGRNYCHNGVMMEYMESAPAKNFDRHNPWQFCLKLNSEFQRLCGQYQIVTFTSKFNYNFQQSAKACAQAPNKILKEMCFHGLGSRTAQQAKGNFNDIKKNCMSISDTDGRITCIIYASDQVIFQEYKDWDVVSDLLCQGLSGIHKEKCLLQKNQTVQLYNKKILAN